MQKKCQTYNARVSLSRIAIFKPFGSRILRCWQESAQAARGGGEEGDGRVGNRAITLAADFGFDIFAGEAAHGWDVAAQDEKVGIDNIALDGDGVGHHGKIVENNWVFAVAEEYFLHRRIGENHGMHLPESGAGSVEIDAADSGRCIP